MIRLANVDDLKFIKQYDYEVYDIEADVKNNLVYIIVEKEFIGFLRYSLFWNRIPFINMFYIRDIYRNKGYGKELLNFFIKEMQNKKFENIMTSCLSEENGKMFFLKNAFKITGGFNSFKEGYELILDYEIGGKK